MGIQLFNVALLAFLLYKILYKPVRGILYRRAERIAEQLVAAEQGIVDANNLKAEYEKKIKEIEVERIEILNAARADAAEKNRQLLEEGKKEAAVLRERAANEIQNERDRLKGVVSAQILDLSVLMAGKFVTQAIDKTTQDRMFEEAISGLEDATWLN
jgi:F-type H+-transporting ATPase subunit b